jgi:hypothetical protein
VRGAQRTVYEGKVVVDPDKINGGPDVMLVGSSFDPDGPDLRGVWSRGSGTFHGRFLLLNEHVGKRVRITLEILEEQQHPYRGRHDE